MKWTYIVKTVWKPSLLISIVFLMALPFLHDKPTPIRHFMVEVQEWSDFETNAKYHKRFWDLVRSTNSSHTLSTQPLTRDNLPYLWRPLKALALDANESSRFVAQTVWQMEASNTTFSSFLRWKTILLWDGFEWWGHQNWPRPKQLLPTDCEFAVNSLTQCTFTEAAEELGTVDAVLLARDNSQTEVEVGENTLRFFYMLESPWQSWALLHRDNDLLASYWRGSDIVTPYAKWVYYDLNKKLRKQDQDYTSGKSKIAAAFITNCEMGNGRLDYIAEMQKYLQVDVYGSCGKFRCSRWPAKYQDCFAMLKKDYYFYLSFENSNCRDYITEKFYKNALSNDIIPIVMGAHPSDYQAMAPYKSYIHIEDFPSPQELAAYLLFLIAHPTQYNKYFEWKGTGEFVSSSFFCQLCAMVHYSDFVPPPSRTKPFRLDEATALEEGICLPRGQWYWTRANHDL